jgi:hypothetical protein
MKNIFYVFILLFLTTEAKAQLFSQDFSSSTVVADYVSASPSTGQFNAINTSSGSTASIVGGTLEFSRTGGSWSAARTTDIGTPDVVFFQIDVNVTAVSAAANGAVTFYFGSGLDNANTAPTNAQTHSRFALSYLSGGNWTVREVGGSNSANTYTGSQTVTFVINNGATDGFYTGPNGTSQSVAIDKWDLWVGNVLEFNDRNATTTTQTLTDFKIHSSTGGGTVQFDNISINAITLPISLKSFTATPLDRSAALLSFATALEQNNDYFSIERSADGLRFSEIGRVQGAGNSLQTREYSYTDNTPLRGINYYRLKQVDYDGKYTFSPVVSLNFDGTDRGNGVRLSPQPVKDQLSVTLEQAFQQDARWELYDLSGRLLQAGTLAAEAERFSIEAATLTNGAYVLRITGDQQVITRKFEKN